MASDVYSLGAKVTTVRFQTALVGIYNLKLSFQKANHSYPRDIHPLESPPFIRATTALLASKYGALQRQESIFVHSFQEVRFQLTRHITHRGGNILWIRTLRAHRSRLSTFLTCLSPVGICPGRYKLQTRNPHENSTSLPKSSTIAILYTQLAPARHNSTEPFQQTVRRLMGGTACF